MEISYNYESVQELLVWAKDILTNEKYPSGQFQINKSTVALDCGKYLESMIAVISHNWENPTFYPTIDQLCQKWAIFNAIKHNRYYIYK